MNTIMMQDYRDPDSCPWTVLDWTVNLQRATKYGPNSSMLVPKHYLCFVHVQDIINFFRSNLKNWLNASYTIVLLSNKNIMCFEFIIRIRAYQYEFLLNTLSDFLCKWLPCSLYYTVTCTYMTLQSTLVYLVFLSFYWHYVMLLYIT